MKLGYELMSEEQGPAELVRNAKFPSRRPGIISLPAAIKLLPALRGKKAA